MVCFRDAMARLPWMIRTRFQVHKETTKRDIVGMFSSFIIKV